MKSIRHGQKIVSIAVIILLVLVPLSNRQIFADDGVITNIGLSSSASPIGLAINPGNGEVLVANNGLGTISTIDSLTNTMIGSPIIVGNGPYGIIYDPSSNHYFV